MYVVWLNRDLHDTVGELAEWSKAVDLSSSLMVRISPDLLIARVRIPYSPLLFFEFLFCILNIINIYFALFNYLGTIINE